MSAGVLMTLPGAASHPWHNDGPALFNWPNAPVLPPHCINVFIPLVDLELNESFSLESVLIVPKISINWIQNVNQSSWYDNTVST